MTSRILGTPILLPLLFFFKKKTNSLLLGILQIMPKALETTIIAVMDKESEGLESQALSDPVLFVSDSSVLEAEIEGSLDKVTQEQQSFKIKFNCLKKGESVVITTIPLNPATVSPIQFALYKMCNPDPLEQSAAEVLENTYIHTHTMAWLYFF